MMISLVSSGGYSPPTATDPAATTTQTVVPSPATQPSAPVELPSKAVQAENTSPSLDQVKNAVAQLNKVAQTMTDGVTFSVDSETGIHVVKVIDNQTNQLISQFPSQEVVDIARSLDKLQGLIIRQKA